MSIFESRTWVLIGTVRPTLWEDLLKDFEDRISKWESRKKIADVIVKKGPYLKMYTVYIKDFTSMNLHFDECCQKHPKFDKLVKVEITNLHHPHSYTLDAAQGS